VRGTLRAPTTSTTLNIHGGTPYAEGASLAAPGNVSAFAEVVSQRSALTFV
jgi:hypothetical protein